jgi:hypothetical protein
LYRRLIKKYPKSGKKLVRCVALTTWLD